MTLLNTTRSLLLLFLVWGLTACCSKQPEPPSETQELQAVNLETSSVSNELIITVEKNTELSTLQKAWMVFGAELSWIGKPENGLLLVKINSQLAMDQIIPAMELTKGVNRVERNAERQPMTLEMPKLN